MLKQLKWSQILMSVSYIILGILLIMFPDISGKVISYVLGIGAIVYGIVNLTIYFLLNVRDSLYRNEFIIGIASIVFGLLIILKSDVIIGLIPLLLGLIIMISGFINLQKGVVAYRIGYNRSMVYVLISAISIIFGVAIMFFMSGKTAMDILYIVIGAGLVYSGASDLIATLVLANRMNAFIRAFEEKAPKVIDVEATEEQETDTQ
ncbi:MAG: DUF308 domain-containing protein [Bulleidia sp.]